MMKTRCIVVFLAVVCLGGPSVHADVELSVLKMIDLGSLQIGQHKEFEFSIFNVSKEKITIGEIKASCSCTDVKLNGESVIEAGQSRVIKGEVVFGGLLGDYKSEVHIDYVNSKYDSRQAIVPIRAKVVTALVLEKSFVDFGSVGLDSGLQTIEVIGKKGNSGEEWDSVRVNCQEKNISAAVAGDSNTAVKIRVSLDPSALPIATLHSSITLQLFCRGQPLAHEIELPITARLQGPMKAVPSTIYFGLIDSRSVDRSVLVSSEKLDLAELEVESHSENLSVEIKPLPNNIAKVEIHIAPKPPGKMFSETLTLVHQHGGVRLQIPILGASAGR